MTRRMRGGLGLLCVAAIGLIIGALAGRSGTENISDMGYGYGGLVALIGFGLIAWELLWSAYTKSSSGERSSGDA